MPRQTVLPCVRVLATAVVVATCLAATEGYLPRRDAAVRELKAGNYGSAYESFRRLALDPGNEPSKVGEDLEHAVVCLKQLGRSEEVDGFREEVIAVHGKNWRLLATAANSYYTYDHNGAFVAGKFVRGRSRGADFTADASRRDRVRALQLMHQALPLTRGEADKVALAGFHWRFAQMAADDDYGEPWRLQYLTDLTKLPECERERNWWPGNRRGAPVDSDGNPILYRVPENYQAAASDGERWRWHLARAVEYEPAWRSEAEMIFANFLCGQFDVYTLAPIDGLTPNRAGSYALHTLADDETIARLATGVKRFKLSDEFNWIKICERVAARGKSPAGESARDLLAETFEDRRQYPRAADAWRKAIAEYGPDGKKFQDKNFRKQRLEQIVGNWGRFEPGETQVAGTKTSVDFRFRNGKKVAFEARAIKVELLLDDVKAYLRGHNGRLDWQEINISDLGYRLVERGENRYLGDKVAAWDVELSPRTNHVDDRITVTPPLQKPGAYLLTAQMANGNRSRVVVWVSDTVLIQKPLADKTYYFVADAVTGKPVPNAEVDFFGYEAVREKDSDQTKTWTHSFAATTDVDGQLFVGHRQLPRDYSWVVTARTKGDKTRAGRFAYLGFSRLWFNTPGEEDLDVTKVFAITDRPVYRPGQTVRFKLWVRHVRYDQPDTSTLAGKSFTVEIFDPVDNAVYKRKLTADAFGGLAGEMPLAAGCPLGLYSVTASESGDARRFTNCSFRVEEYKKPEFEASVAAPAEPARLGERVTATVKANYYFGAPVTKAKVKYKVLRTSYTPTWYPRAAWDWFYGRGYWWFAADYSWYPGWSLWGCRRPMHWWDDEWDGPNEPPELVLDDEAQIGPDGTLKVSFDTLPAKELHGDQDHRYSITAEVTDESRRTIVATGDVMVAREPFKVFVRVDRGYYQAGEAVEACVHAQTLDGKPVTGKGDLTLYKISYDERNEPFEKPEASWKHLCDDRGETREQFKVAEPGQYRLSFKLMDAAGHTVEGGYLFVVRGPGFDGKGIRFNGLELITDKREYAPGEKVRLLINADRAGAAVLLFVRPALGAYPKPKLIQLRGKSTVEEITVGPKDVPNFFVEAVTVSDGDVRTEAREVIVPPASRMVDVKVLPSREEYKPGQKGTIKIKLTDLQGRPFAGSVVVTVYDKSLEYVSEGSNIPDIKEFFWKWRRGYYPSTLSSVRPATDLVREANPGGMSDLGIFGSTVVEEMAGGARTRGVSRSTGGFGGRLGAPGISGALGGLGVAGVPGVALGIGGALGVGGVPGNQLGVQLGGFQGNFQGAANLGIGGGGFGGTPDVQEQVVDLVGDKSGRRKPPDVQERARLLRGVEPAVRKNLADSALWIASLTAGPDGVAEVSLTMPENLTGWKVRVWALGHGTRVGQGEAEVTTKKDLLVRLQAPRFFVEKDEVVLSANVHNYLKSAKAVRASLELEGGVLMPLGSPVQDVQVASGGERRVDWRVRVRREGEAVVRVKAVTDEESDAVEMRFPCYSHCALKTDSFAGTVRPEDAAGKLSFDVPTGCDVSRSRLEVRYTPTLAGALIDALPYLADYPYGCTEQTLNRFVPTVVTQRVLQDLKLDLKAIRDRRTNLEAQESGNAGGQGRGWQRHPHAPVFDPAEVRAMAEFGVKRLAGMQCSDGGWGWFSGSGEQSWPHTTAVVVHGLQLAKHGGVPLPQGMLERGLDWLKSYRARELTRLANAATRTRPWNDAADNLDALVQMVLYDAGEPDGNMGDFLYRDRKHLSVYGKCMLGLTLDPKKHADQLAMVLKSVEQYVVRDEENQTAYLRLPADNVSWHWYGSEVESQAYYLKLLAHAAPKSPTAPRLVRYLLNNRKHANYWESTRDTAACIEALADYLKASGEDRPDLNVEIWLDGKKQKEVKIDASNVFTVDNSLVLGGDAIATGRHVLEVRKHGTGPVYFNAYLTNFTPEEFIKRAGLEVKVDRKYYRLKKVEQTTKVQGARGQAADQQVEKYERSELANLATLKSGDLVEVELTIDSKNDYEYLLVEDPKAAGFEPELVRSGYYADDLGSYMELRDDRVCFFVRELPWGRHSVSYRLRAEVPGRFSALPARASAMYAPELRGNSDEIKLAITD